MGASHRLVLISCCLAVLPAVQPLPAQEADLPPVERRAQELFALLRDGDAAAMRAFVDTGMHPSFRDMAPVEMHLEQLGRMRETLGVFEVDEIRISGPDRGDFVLATEAGERFVLHVETEPIEPYRLAGIGLRPYEPEHQVAPFTDLEQAETELGRLAGANAFSGVVLVARKGKPDWVRAYGMADKERGIPNRPQTRFDVGSITKDFTAVAILQLVEQGKVELDAPMSRYLEGFPPEIADKVKVIHLLRMESGYGDYYTREFMERREDFVTISDFLDYFRTMSLEFEPGTQQRYSNVGYTILGGIVESVSGMSYPDYLRRYIYEPAGMRASSFRNLEAREPDYAIGYTNDGPSGRRGYVDTNRTILDVRGNASGGSLSTVGDLLRFQRALRANELLSPEHTTFLLNGFEEGGERAATRGIAGGAPGVSAVSLEDAAAGINVIVLSNYDEPVAEEVGSGLFRMLRDGGQSARRSSVAVVLPMEIRAEQPIVEVSIDGTGPYRFLVDTGAAGAGRIDEGLAERLGLEVSGQAIVGDPSGRTTETRDLVRVGRLALGPREWTDVDLLLGPMDPGDRGIDGILGFDLFRDGLLTLDYPAGELRLERGALDAGEKGVVTFSDENGIPTIELDVAGTTVEADVDSGSMGGLMIPESVATGLPLAAEPRVVGKASTSFTEFEIKAAPLAGIAKLGDQTLENPDLAFADVFPRANLGGRFLRDFAVTFDRENRRARFVRDGERGPRYRVGVMLGVGPEGVVVDSTVPGSPAARAGLKPGDRVLRVNGDALDDGDAETLTAALGRPEEVALVVDRQGEQLEIRLTPEPVR